MKIKIGGMTYDVAYVQGLRDEEFKPLWGSHQWGKALISIEQDMSEQAQRQVLWHEIIHGILTQAGFGEQDERIVDTIAHGLVQVLADNPELRQS